MSITVTCDECATIHRIRDNAAGQRFACRGCGRKLLVVVPSTSRSSDSTTKDSDDDSSDTLNRDDLRELVRQLATPESPSACPEVPASPSAELARQLAATASPAAPIEESPSFGKRLVGFGLVLVLLVGWGYFATLVAGSFREAWRSNSWPSVMGTVKSSAWTGGKNASVKVTYSYDVNSINHSGHRICVYGYSKKVSESVQTVSDRYVVDQPVKVFYDPTNPASAVLLTGATREMWFQVFLLAVYGTGFGYGTYASFRSLIGKPLPQNGRSFVQRALGLFAAGMMVLVVGILIFVLVTTSRHWHLPRDLGEWFGLVLMLILVPAFLSLMWLVLFGVYCSFKPAAKESDLRAEPGVPLYSDSSLVCIGGVSGRVSAVIVDDHAGMIHFRSCFRPRGFWVIKALPWFSCPLSTVTSVSQMSYKGTTTLTIHTDAGQGSIGSYWSGFEELKRRFPKTISEYAPGTAPLSGTQAGMVVAGILGIIGGMMLSIMNLALGILVLVGASVLLVSSLFVAPKE